MLLHSTEKFQDTATLIPLSQSTFTVLMPVVTFHYGWENVLWCCVALLHCSSTDLIQPRIQLVSCILLVVFFFFSFSLMQDSFLGLTISMLFWYNSHLSPLLTNCRCDCPSSFCFRCNCISDILLISGTFAGLNIYKIKLSKKDFVPITFCFCSPCFKMHVQVMGIFFFFIFAASGSCIAGEQFSYCFIQMYIGGDLQMPVLLEYFSILKVLDQYFTFILIN